MKKMLLPVITALIVLTSCAASKKLTAEQQYMNKQYKELKNVLNEAEVSILNDSLKVIFPDHILFATASDQLKDDIKPTFERFAGVLNKYDKTKIMITGHTDNTGVAAYNRDLSERRAVSAKQLLNNNKVDNERMFTWGLADRDPIGDNTTEAGKAKNRRVEFVILYNLK
ncbi:OmpA family protein [Chitinophaga niabensis]|uniref:Outer membrane protein OmpA n=1 Tax=Chitinophaga niabensis TaxID=536979 RepID=A0A1N6GQU3_9BACT|nr:OmpA family protein [Chitinophaga niabensis]SIO09785.1 Outer membrane protein OmpA [Chitinophaga niabensis]